MSPLPSAPMSCAGHDFAAPRRSDRKAWSVVAVVLGRVEPSEPR
ncbi:MULTISPECIES: hypothetical protein [unclassified Streptomyces]|nr:MULTISPECIES: hypothetical protein [unclassified Streptomyces]